ncbi:MAG: rhamnulokinase [Anaerolineae bacterium]|nr:rhamnulokinase [Anaerolineae bacterium]
MVSKAGLYLAIDLGAESGRVISGTLDDKRLILNEIHRFSNGPVKISHGSDISMHWDVLRLWSEIKTGISQAKKGGMIKSLGLDTWGVDFALLDKHGNLLGNPYHYRDSRTDNMLDEAFKRLPKETIFEQTGIQFMQINTLYQLLSMVTHQAESLKCAKTFLTMPDLFNYWLTGKKYCEFSIATTTQCFDPRKGTWAYALLEKMGIPSDIFPPIIQPGSILGELQPALVEELGISGVKVLTPACHDTGSAVAAIPAENEDYVWISSGTWSIMGIVSAEPVITADSLAYNFTNEGGALLQGQKNTYRYSKNTMGLWLVQECRRTWAASGQDYSYAQLTEMAAGAEPLVSLVNPDHNDFLKPGDMPARIQAFCKRTGQKVPQSPGEIVRCALESTALNYRLVHERLEASVGKRFDTIHIIGGGTQNRLLNQLAADATGCRVITGPIEATATGNILLQALAQNDIASIDELRQIVRTSFETNEYHAQSGNHWDAAFKTFINLLAE